MTDAKRSAAAKCFAEQWAGRGDEKSDTQSFWLSLLRDVLSWKGLPCPNLGTGGFNFHGVCECTTVERMDRATEVLLNIIGIYAE